MEPPEARAKELLGELADQRLLEQVERWQAPAPTTVPAPPEPRPEPRLHIHPEDWRTGFLRVEDYEPPLELRADLKELSPQALLRDLERVEFQLRPVAPDYIETGLGDVLAGPAHTTSEALARLAPPHVPRMAEAVSELQAYQHSLRTVPWQPLRPDDAPRAIVLDDFPADES